VFEALDEKSFLVCTVDSQVVNVIDYGTKVRNYAVTNSLFMYLYKRIINEATGKPVYRLNYRILGPTNPLVP
jgi:hypothetical protein